METCLIYEANSSSRNSDKVYAYYNVQLNRECNTLSGITNIIETI